MTPDTAMPSNTLKYTLRILLASLASAPSFAGESAIPKCSPMPALLHVEPVKYPSRESRTAVEGAVTIEFIVRPDGTVTDTRVVEVSPPKIADWLNAPALEAVKRYQYAAVKSSCQGQTRIVFRIVQPSS